MTAEDESPQPKKRPWWDTNDDPVINPWQAVAPPCPHCANPDVWMWHPSGSLRWYCSTCKRRFDPPKPEPTQDSKARDALVQRDSKKFPALGRELAKSDGDKER